MAVYFIQAAAGPVKIGFSLRPLGRLPALQIGTADTLTMLRVIEGDLATEAEMHARFADLHIRGEWFHYHPDMRTVGVAWTKPAHVPKGNGRPSRWRLNVRGGTADDNLRVARRGLARHPPAAITLRSH